MIGTSPMTIGKVCRLFRKTACNVFVVVKDGRPAGVGRILSSEQEREAQRLIMDRTADRLKLPHALRSR